MEIASFHLTINSTNIKMNTKINVKKKQNANKEIILFEHYIDKILGKRTQIKSREREKGK